MRIFELSCLSCLVGASFWPRAIHDLFTHLRVCRGSLNAMDLHALLTGDWAAARGNCRNCYLLELGGLSGWPTSQHGLLALARADEWKHLMTELKPVDFSKFRPRKLQISNWISIFGIRYFNLWSRTMQGNILTLARHRLSQIYIISHGSCWTSFSSIRTKFLFLRESQVSILL